MNSGSGGSGIPFPPEDSKLVILSGTLPQSGSTTLTLPSGSNYLFLKVYGKINTEQSSNCIHSVIVNNGYCISPYSSLLGSIGEFNDTTKDIHFLSDSGGYYYLNYISLVLSPSKMYYLITGGSTLTITGKTYFSPGLDFKVYFYKYS